MTAGIYTTTVDVVGGTETVDDWGDPAEGQEVILAGVPALIVENRRVAATESDPQAVVVHYLTGRVPAGTTVTAANRLRDTVTGTLYLVDHVHQPTNPAVPADVRLDLRRVS
jgi:hypothetical protein